MFDAKIRSIDWFNQYIERLCTSLELDVSTVSSDMDIPVSEDDRSYTSFKCLKDMLTLRDSLGE